jgi:hypothetical protein
MAAQRRVGSRAFIVAQDPTGTPPLEFVGFLVMPSEDVVEPTVVDMGYGKSETHKHIADHINLRFGSTHPFAPRTSHHVTHLSIYNHRHRCLSYLTFSHYKRPPFSQNGNG